MSDQAASNRSISRPSCAQSNRHYLAGASVSAVTSCDVDVAGARTVSFSSNCRGPRISAEGGCAILQAYARVPPRSPARPLTSSRFSHDRLRVASPHGYTAPGGAAPSPASAPAPRAQLWLKPVGLELLAPQEASARPDVYVRQRGQGGTSALTTLMHSKRVSRPNFARRTCGVRRLATPCDLPGLMAARRLATAGRSLRHPRISRSVGADSPR